MKNENIDPRLFDLLEELKPVASRDSHTAARGRTQFLTEAVSLREKQRHSGWTVFPFKEKFAMKLIVSTLVIVGLLFGGGATVSAAQDDLPNQPLYPVKLMSEDVQLWFVSDPVHKVNMLIEQAQTRIQEMETLAAQGTIPPQDIAVRAQERIQRALQIVAQLDPAAQIPVLQQIQTRLQTQDQQMLHLEQGMCTECVPVLQQTHQMLQLQLREVENGLGDPNALQDQTQTQTQNQTQNQNQLRINQTPPPTGAAIPPYGTCTPVMEGTGQQNGSGSPSGGTPVQQQNQTQQNNQNSGGTQNGNGSGGGGSQTGSGGGSSTGSGGTSGKP